MSPAVRLWTGRVLWALAVVLVSAGAAGLIVSLDHVQTDAGRPELAARGDERMARHLPTMRAALDTLVARSDAVADAARDVGRTLRDLEPDAARAAIASGDRLLLDARAAAADVTSAREAALAEITDARISDANAARLAAIDAAAQEAGGLPAAWSAVAAPATAATDVLERMQTHDELVFDATTAARDERYTDALATLDRADTVLRGLGSDKDALERSGLEVPTLNAWLLRAADYAAALGELYDILESTNGSPTQASAAALGDVERAQQALPETVGAFVVIVSEVSEPALTQGQLQIEGIRGRVEAATATLD